LHIRRLPGAVQPRKGTFSDMRIRRQNQRLASLESNRGKSVGTAGGQAYRVRVLT
jgi:hypothetical protein